MKASDAFRIMIVGGGPAGLATALHLAHLAPELAEQILIVEAAQHPRPKICGGGVTFHGEEQLRRLGIHMTAPAFPVQSIRFQLERHAFTTTCPNAMRIFQRHEFDAALAAAVDAHGLTLHNNEKLLTLEPSPTGIVVTTSKGCYHTKVVVAADGANSTVRRLLGLRSTCGIARLLRVLRPIDPAQTPHWQTGQARFDFSCISQGIQGYVWDFPCFVDHQPYVNHGIFDSRIVPQAQITREAHPPHHLKEVFAAHLRAQNVDLASTNLQGHPVRWFNANAEFARPHVLLVGDAAGVDALFAEGISYAMEYGAVAAAAVRDAFVREDFSFGDYRARLLQHRLSRSLQRRALIASHLYRFRQPWVWRWLWRAAAIAPAVVNQFIGAALDVLPPLYGNQQPYPSTKPTFVNSLNA